MRAFLVLLLVVIVGGAGYGYLHNPEGYFRLCHDFVALYTETSVPAEAPAQPTVAPTPAPLPATSATTAAPTPAVTPAPAASTDTTAASPPAQPFKKWTPPTVIPAQPHWTWTTDDKTYQDVVINQIDASTVTITHSMGVTHLDIATLPADIQKQLGYDPEMAAAAKAEAKREADHPYYTMSTVADAEALAKQMHWPIAWLCSLTANVTIPNPDSSSDAGLTQLALNDLKTQTIVILENGNDELHQLPPAVIAELFHLDDGPLPDGHHYYAPKIVFSNADATKTFGRVSNTQMKAAGSAPIDAILSNIQTDPAIQAILSGQPAPASPASPPPDAAAK